MRSEGLDYSTGQVTNPGHDDNVSIVEFNCQTDAFPLTYTFSTTPGPGEHVINMQTVSSQVISVADMDGDGDLEIIFTTQNGSSGDLFAIHHNGEDVVGFPAEIDEKMRVGPALGDLDDDGVIDIVIVSATVIVMILQVILQLVAEPLWPETGGAHSVSQ